MKVARSAHGWDTPIGPVSLDGISYSLRVPRIDDAGLWRAARSAERDRLLPAFGRTDLSWEEAHAPVIWVESWMRMRSAAKRGEAIFFVVIETISEVATIVGEVAVAGIDPNSGSGELSIWVSRRATAEVAKWAIAETVLRAFDAPYRIPRVIGPIAVSNRAPARLAESMGFVELAQRRALRVYNGEPTDHALWVFDNNERNRTRMRNVVKR
ncbi:GNAT family N-acetyltransferase [Antrihabitans sp. YC3-6]|uniref:GNAT family N-acetyltransferase n=1 Tax=Antrihabitans stalagmiti TaxID=2799499 RepID=A0A934U4L3_9NOCA|nr:GNAT family N-acetyltransferase [Antrihabitans stalagmiti]MBJ8340472.1 GNAT family N-acetyltransferase [Antrihabitans stalagmiti]